jgi:hypothetical protein
MTADRPTGAVSAKASELTEGVRKAMLRTKRKSTAAALLAAIVVAAGLAVGCGQSPPPAADGGREAARPPASPQTPPDPDALPAPAERFPVLAWGGPPEDQTTVERYRELAEAGFTHNLTSVSDADAAARALEAAAAMRVNRSFPVLSCRGPTRSRPSSASRTTPPWAGTTCKTSRPPAISPGWPHR